MAGHDAGRVVWCRDGCGRAVPSEFLDGLGEEGRAALEVVTADGARRMADVVAEGCPNAEGVMGPFHVVRWATDAPDRLRRQAWNAPRRGPGADPAAAGAVKGGRCALLESPEDLTERQSGAPASVSRAGGALWRGRPLKEGLGAVSRSATAAEASEALGRWLSWARRCGIPGFVEVSRKVGCRREAVVGAVALGVSNARVEATNNKVKLAVRTAYGFRNVGNLLATVMLRCSRLSPRLPGRG